MTSHFNPKPESATAAILIIGGEILSGQTADINVAFIARQLKTIGIPVKEVRIIPDHRQTIIDSVRALSAAYTYVITTGGIGPTHDDITADAIAGAFMTTLYRDPVAVQLLKDRYGESILGTDDLRLSMADVPMGCTLIDNPVSAAPGFQMKNVYALAGVPPIMQGMLMTLLPRLTGGIPIYEESVFCPLIESRLARPLAAIQNQYPHVDIGSYPTTTAIERGVRIALTSTNRGDLDRAKSDVITMISGLQQDPTAVL